MTAREPLSRRLMVALFVLMIVPMGSWYFVEVRWQLALVFAASVAVFGGTVLYVRRTVLDPLVGLARRARSVGSAPWEAPPELDRGDEIGDLATALHSSVIGLENRAREALQFATSLSHELRTPLAAIRGAAEILTEENLDAEERARFIRNISTESERLERLVLGLLDLERARVASAWAPAGDTCDLEAEVAAVVERSAPLLARKALEVRTSMPPVPPAAVSGDHAQRILLGLLENAIKFSPSGGTISVDGSAAEDGMLRMEVTDQGPGVDPTLSEAIFDRHFVGTDQGRGTGLGLAIVRSLVEAAGGRIWAERGPVGGARFCYTLPIAGGRA